MPSPSPFEFWFDPASTYSYPAAMRVEDLARRHDLALAWRPFLLGPLFARQGWNDSPFNLNPVRGRYMWHDVARTCSVLNLPFRRPSVFPRRSLLAARVALLGEDAPWGPPFIRAVFTANFGEDREIADRAVIGDILTRLGVPVTEVLQRAEAQETKDRLRVRTEEAWSRGIFGAPSVLVGDELFWGNDRLEQAAAYARGDP